jgi:hypothetical protein
MFGWKAPARWWCVVSADRSDAAISSERTARDRLAGFWNAWFYPHEIEKAHALAETAMEEECQAELDRLHKQRDSRLEHWRWSQ